LFTLYRAKEHCQCSDTPFPYRTGWGILSARYWISVYRTGNW